ncbi:Mucosa-associated lymphoid tissue lymphoma translocation protein 1-like protein [Gryllus bimaculatus]|nr:Mucosa-associated lymphoid tissue lymphoma translocation protein 1-like protein [Gryllus bimaculatus]
MTALPDPDSGIKKLNGAIYRALVEKLNKRDAWRRLASSLPLPILNEESLEQKPCPATTILNALDDRLWKVKNLRSLLLRCELYDAAAVLSEPKPLTIEVQPGEGEDNDVYVPFGGELRLEIIAKGVPPPRYLWYCENEELTDQRTSILRIGDFGLQHIGEYKCLVYQDCSDGHYQEYSVPVNVMMLPEPPVIQEQPESKTVNIGEEVIISCKAVSYPPPTYEWMRDNTVLVDQNGPVLKIPHASLSHSGIYKCSVSNGYNVKVTEPVKLSVTECSQEPTREMPIVTEKVALLIANVEYANLQDLCTPYNDVKALSHVLMDLGFKVLSLCNLTLVEMINAVKTFCKLIPEGAYTIFYFAGHGFELHDKYMLPVECPTSDMYRRSDSLCERHVIKEVLARKPNLLLLMLDIEENPGMHDELVAPIVFEPQRNLIQAYATTSSLGAYERKTETNGIYMKHLLKYLSINEPIVNILNKVIEKNLQTKQLFDELTSVQKTSIIRFDQIRLTTPHQIRLYQDCFHNGIEIHLKDLDEWSIGCEIQSTELEMQLKIDKGVKILTILNLQKLKPPILDMTIELRDKRGTLVDNAWFEIGQIPIVSANLWFSPPVEVDQNEEGSVLSF